MSDELEMQLAEARAVRDAANAEVGRLLLDGKDKAKGAAATKALKAAQAKVDELEAAASAILAAKEAALKAEADRQAQEAEAELQRLLRSACDSHANLVALARKADEANAAFVDALADLEAAADDFVETHRPLNLGSTAVSVLRHRGWIGQIFTNLRNHGPRGFRMWFAQKHIPLGGSGQNKPIVDAIPALPQLLGSRGEA